MLIELWTLVILGSGLHTPLYFKTEQECRTAIEQLVNKPMRHQRDRMDCLKVVTRRA